jgi:peroxiredoxin
MLLLRDRRDDLAAAGVRPFGLSRDSPWSRRAWSEALGLLEAVTLLSDWNGEATRGFEVAVERGGMVDVPARSAFLVEGDTVRAAWMLGRELPDVDAVIAAASSFSR